LPREVYDTNHRQFSDRVAAIEVVIATTAGREKGIGLSASTLIAGLTVLAAVITTVVVVANYITRSVPGHTPTTVTVTTSVP